MKTPHKTQIDLSGAWDELESYTPYNEMACGWGATRVSYWTFWNFLWCKCDFNMNPFQDFNPKRLICSLWWVPNLKEAKRVKVEKSKKHYIIHHDNENINPA